MQISTWSDFMRRNTGTVLLACVAVLCVTAAVTAQLPKLAEPFATPSVRNNVQIVAKPDASQLKAPAGFEVSLYADNLRAPRTMLLAPNGDVFVAQSGPGSVTILRDANNDGTPETRSTYAQGLSGVFGMALHDGYLYLGRTDIIWTSVNERDTLGDDLVPDYITSVKDGAFYGWPYSYIGSNPDPEHVGKMPDLVRRALVPDVLITAHSAAVSVNFYTGTQFPQRYRNGAFVGLHGSWNRSKVSGYRIGFVPFQNGKPSGPIEDFVTGWIVDGGTPATAWGRPVGTLVMRDGSMLVADDAGNKIWKVRYTGKN